MPNLLVLMKTKFSDEFRRIYDKEPYRIVIALDVIYFNSFYLFRRAEEMWENQIISESLIYTENSNVVASVRM